MVQSCSCLISHTLILTIFGSPFPWYPFLHFSLYSRKDWGESVTQNLIFKVLSAVLISVKWSRSLLCVFSDWCPCLQLSLRFQPLSRLGHGSPYKHAGPGTQHAAEKSTMGTRDASSGPALMANCVRQTALMGALETAMCSMSHCLRVTSLPTASPPDIWRLTYN